MIVYIKRKIHIRLGHVFAVCFKFKKWFNLLFREGKTVAIKTQF